MQVKRMVNDMLTVFGMGVMGSILLISSGVFVERSVSRVGKIATFLVFALIPLTVVNVYVLFQKLILLVENMSKQSNTFEDIMHVFRFTDVERILLLVFWVVIILHFIFARLYQRKGNNASGVLEEKDAEG